ncbi:hypothetical protein [Sediminitomix flava]|uniref:SpoIIAA-like protein n=1 Tax=Sediminitomix flava TaxID=379075 RepID=A0A315Z8B1_SEDFL|nr:hypothetical protein [Sediminitomix flava]PWJ40986.1 hypothetical protein BC781_104252 [Sediminitomix flava]
MNHIYQPQKALYSYAPYFEIYLDKSQRLVRTFWHLQSEWMSDDEFKECMYNFWELVCEHNPICILSDTRLFNFIIDSELQEWYGELSGKYTPVDLKKMAYLKSSGLIEQFSIEQAVDEDPRTYIQTSYFNTEQDAYNWLKLTK